MTKPTHMTMRARTTRMRAARLLALVALALVASTLAPTPAPASASSRPTGEDTTTTTTTTTAPTGSDNGSNTGSGCTAAQALGYTNATFDDDFEGSGLDTENWSPYRSGSAHRWGQGRVTEEGRRRPEQITVEGGVLKINGLGASYPASQGADDTSTTPSLGDTGGMEMVDGKQHGYGLWEARVKIPQNVVNYHPVLILWPSGTEINFMEVLGPSGQQISGRDVQGYAHMGGGNERDASTSVNDDGWHNWAVEWIEGKITFYLDGREWFTTESQLTGQAGMTIQLDWFPWTEPQGSGGQEQDVRSTTTDAELQIDWVRSYEVANKGSAGTCSGSNTTCPSGQANSLGQCTQPANDSTGGNGSTGSTCGWYQVPDPQVQQRFFPNLPQGSVMVFNVCVDSAGLVTAANGGCSTSGTGSQTTPTADDQGQGAQDRCIGPVSVGTGSSTDANSLHPPCQSTGTTQPADNQTGQNGQNASGCYRQLPQGYRIDASLATALMLSDATAALNGWRPDLIAKPAAGQPAIIDEPTFVCVSNFPSGTNFPGAISVGGHGQHGGQGGSSTTSSSTTTTTTRPPTQTFAGSPGGDPPAGSGDTTTTTTTRPTSNNTPTGNDGSQTGSFQPGIVGDLAASQQACLQAQGQTPQVDGDSSCQNQSGGTSGADPDEDDSGEQEAGSNPQTFRGEGEGGSGDTTTTTTTAPTNSNCTNGNGSSTNPLQSVSDMICGQTTTPTTPTTSTSTSQPSTGAPISTQPVTDDQTGNQVGACMSMQLYPVIRYDPGDGSEIVECAAPGSLVAENASEEQADAAAGEAAACTHIYTRRTGSGSQQGVQGWRAGDERPSEWPGRVSVVWRADTDACIVHAPGGSTTTNFAAGASHPATNPLNTTMPIDLTSLGEDGQAPDTSQTGEIPGQQGTYDGQPAAGIDAEGREVQSPWTPLPRQVDEGSGQNTTGGS